MIDRMLVVVFETEEKAYQGKRALEALHLEGSITVYASAVVAKNPDGTATVKESDSAPPIATIFGTPVGALIGMLGGPVGVAVGTTVGFMGGFAADVYTATIDQDFVDDVKKDLLPNKYAVIAEIGETWTMPVDTRMEAIGGTVYRRALGDVKRMLHDEHVAAMKADMAQLKAEHAKSQADRQAKLHAKMNALDAKIQARQAKVQQQRQAADVHAQAKAEVLRNKAATLKATAAQTHN
jgi:uncharacterized membrane protein